MANFIVNKWVKRAAQGLSLATVAAIMQACYGMPGNYMRDVIISGKVLNSDGEPIVGIDIDVNGEDVAKSGSGGSFSFYFLSAEEYAISFKGNETYAGRDTTIFREDRQRIAFDFKLEEK